MKGTIKSKADVERLFQRGRRSSSSLMTVIIYENGGLPVRYAFIAGKKLGCAPFRNRCKRVMRDAVRLLDLPVVGYDIAFVARRRVGHASQGEIVTQMSQSLSKLGVM